MNNTAIAGNIVAMDEPCQSFPRIQKIRTELLLTPNSICLERPCLLKEFSKSKEGRISKNQHPFIRRAKALAYIFSNRQSHIYQDELIIGNMTSKRIAANYYPEGGSINILEDLFKLEKRQTPLKMSSKEKWKLFSIAMGSVFDSVGVKALLRPGRISHFLNFFRAKRYFVTEEAGIAHQVGGYHNVVHHGLIKAEKEAVSYLKSGKFFQGQPLTDDQIAFYQSVKITIKGICNMALNLAEKAEKRANSAGIAAKRKAELLEAAAACRHVPYRPARSFKQGLQACWLVHIAMNLEDFEQGLSFGRLDQILYPLYCQDIEQGKLTLESAIETLASFQLKTCETIPLYSDRIDRFFSGNGVAQGITLGGTDENGYDVTNELSGLFLNAFDHIRTREPALHVRVHKETPDWFLQKAVETVQLGCGKPSFFGDNSIVRALEGVGMTKAHARDYAIIGCVEMASQGRTYNSSDAALFNLPLCLELALNRGKQFASSGWYQPILGAKTSAISRMTCFEDVVKAFKHQVEDSVNEMVTVIGWLEDSYRIWRTTPVNSIITEGCMENGLDITWGSALYNLTSVQVAGLADAGDSLYALNKLVFEEKRYSLEELVKILKSNFKGFEILQEELINKFPRYGNGIAKADQMTQLAADIFSDTIRSHYNGREGQFIPGMYSMTCHIGFGQKTGALPNGRSAGYRLSNGLSPVDGSDRAGPTGALRSASSLDSSQWANGCALNMKFDKKSVQGKAGRLAMAGLFKTYFEQGGMQVQVNVLDTKMLQTAKNDPSAYPGLVVRVAGYCAYFNDLQPEVQDEIIERTVH